jgi:gluconolactonase
MHSIKFNIASAFAITILLSCSHRHGLDLLLQKGARPEKVAGGFLFTEGPASDIKGRIYFTDQPNNRIMIFDLEKGVSVFMDPAGRSNGMMFDSKGFLWSCADERNQIWRISPDKKKEVIVGEYDAKVFNGPNDLWIRPDGGIYFTDPYYLREWWDHKTMPQEVEGVYYLAPGSKTPVRVADDLLKPNGITGTPDGKKLYVADIGEGKTWSYTISADGVLSGKKLFCSMGSDGMAIDTRGDIYLTGKGVTVYDSSGIELGNIPVPENWTTNVCFGDSDFQALYITAGGSLYRIRLIVTGIRG